MIDVDGNTDNICLTDVIISDNDGESLDVTVEDCISIKISETIEKSSYTFTVLFKKDQVLNVGDPVDMLGEKIGEVSHTNFMEQKNAVELSIDNSYAFSIPLDSEFEVTVDSLFGRYISITPGYNKNIIEIGMNSLEDVYGLQFQISGANIVDAFGGSAADAGFMISSSSTTVIGFSMTGGYVPKGRYSIMEVEFVLQSSRICLDGLVVSGEMGNALNYEIGECWIH